MPKKQVYSFVCGPGHEWRTDLADAFRKAVGGRGGCALCDIARGPLGEKPDWKEFRTRLGEQAAFFRPEDLPAEVAEYVERAGVELPAILEWTGFGYHILVSKPELADCQGKTERLFGLLEGRMELTETEEGGKRAE